MSDTETITCKRCGHDKVPSAFPYHNRSTGARRRVCRACGSRSVTLGTKSASPVDPSRPRRAVPPRPTGFTEVDPWKFAPRVGPYVVHSSRTGTVPRGARLVACDRPCAERVIAEHAPPVYTHLRPYFYGEGHRAVERPPVTRVGGLDRAGVCAACGREIEPRTN